MAKRPVRRAGSCLYSLVFLSSRLLTKAQGLIAALEDHPFSAVSPECVLRYIEAVPANGTVAPSGSNFTMMPDECLLHPGTVPVLTIRDPRAAVPSAYRVLKAMGLPHGSGRPNFIVSTVPLWLRMLYEYYTANGIEPVIVDGDDLMTDSEFGRQLCLKLGLDPAQAIFSWPTPSQEEKDKLHPNEYASQKNLIDSTGVDPSKAAKNRDLDAEERQWDGDFGLEDAALVREMIKMATPHYQYLYERRFKS